MSLSNPPANPSPPPLQNDMPTTYVSLTYEPLDPTFLLARVGNPAAGASVLFVGTTRDVSRPEGAYLPTHPEDGNSENRAPNGHAHGFAPASSSTTPSDANTDESKPTPPAGYAPVLSLSYTAYGPLALRTLNSIASTQKEKHGLCAVAISHRLGPVPVGEASVVVAVSAAHRGAAWAGGEECLEEVKRRAEIWKWEVFAGDEGRQGWRGNVTDGGGREKKKREEDGGT